MPRKLHGTLYRMPSMISPIRVTYEEELKLSTHIIFHGREQGIFHPLTLPTHLILTTELFLKALPSKLFVKKRMKVETQRLCGAA